MSKSFLQTSSQYFDLNKDKIYIIGGSQIYQHFLPYADELVITEIKHKYDTTIFFPTFDKTLWKRTFLSIEENRGLSYYLSMPNKISDYIQARVPVVVSDFPEMRKVVDHYHAGEKISAYSELPEKILSVLEKGKGFYEFNLNHAAQELCWEKEESKILSLFEKVKMENF